MYVYVQICINYNQKKPIIQVRIDMVVSFKEDIEIQTTTRNIRIHVKQEQEIYVSCMTKKLICQY